MRLVLELDRPDSDMLNDAGFPSTQRFRSAVTVRIPWVERSEAESEDAMWEHIEQDIRKSLAIELLGSGESVLARLTKTLCGRMRTGKFERLPGFLGDHVVETEPSPSSDEPSSDLAPPPTPTLPSGVAPPVAAPESVDGEAGSGVG